MHISDWSADVCSSYLARLVSLAVRQAYAIALLQTVSNRPEPTIARLRYSLGGDRPSQTTRHRGSLIQFHGSRLDIRKQQGGISQIGRATCRESVCQYV